MSEAIRRVVLSVAVVVASVVTPSTTRACTIAKKDVPGRSLPSYAMREHDAATVTAIKKDLAAKCFADALSKFFARGFTGHFADWVIYIDANGNTTQSIVRGVDYSHDLRNESYVWAVIFSETPMVPSVKASDTVDLHFARRVKMYQADQMIPLLIKSFARGFIDVGAVPTLGDSARPLFFASASRDQAAAPLWVAIGRFGMIENAEVELSVTPGNGKEFPYPPTAADSAHLKAIYANLSNSKERMFELSIMPALTYGDPIKSFGDDRLVKGQSSRFAGNAYLSAVMNVVWAPAFPWHRAWQRTPIGGFLGTNVLRNGVGDEFVDGLVVGRVFGEAGVSLAQAWITEPRIEAGRTVSRRRPRALLGFDLRF